MKKLIASAAFAAFTVAPAFAQEAAPFSGPWIGVTGGYDNVKLKVDGESGHDDGFLYGVNAGYDINLGTAIIGAEAELSDSTTKETVTDGTESLSLAATRDIYAGVRLGFPVNPSVMLYAKGGYTNARFKLSYDDNAGGDFTASDNLDGFRLGAGVEYTNGRALARLEYRYSDYGTYKYQGINTGLKVSRQQVAVTGGFRF